MNSVNAKVMVQKDGQKAAAATVTRAHTTLVDYDILYPDGTVVEGMAAHMLRDLRVSIPSLNDSLACLLPRAECSRRLASRVGQIEYSK